MIEYGAVGACGEPDLVAAMPCWYLPVERNDNARPHVALPEPGLAFEAAN